MYDVAIVGGGIVGLATARELLLREPRRRIILIEKEPGLARHQTGHNSGVIHSGLYYRPGSLKARICRAGVAKLVAFCREQGVDHDICGKVIVATNEDERHRLVDLAARGRDNGVGGLRLLGPEELRDIEPHAGGVAGLLSPETGIVSFTQVASALAALLERGGADIRLSSEVLSIRGNVLETTTGEVEARQVICCGGLFADRLATQSGLAPPLLVVGFRGEYYRLKAARRHLVRHLIYPVPDPRFPFLGVHFTRRIDGSIEAGPNAVLAWAREGYSWGDVSWRDLAEMTRYPGFWRMGARYWRTALGETYRSLSKSAFVSGLERLVPTITAADLEPGGSGVRAMALGRDGRLLDDFAIERSGRMVHVLNAPSPAATSALAIAEHVAELAS